MKLEEAIAELKNIWKETDFENSKRRISIETVLKKLQEYEEGNIVSLKLLEKFYLVNKDKEKQMTLSNKELFDDYIPKKKMENVIKELKEMNVEGEVFTTAVNFAIKEIERLLEEK